MTMTMRIFATILTATLALPSMAGTDPLWDAAEERAWRSRDLVAAVVTTRTEIADGDGDTLEVIEDTQRVTGWNAGKPVHKNETKHTVVRKAGMNVKFNFSGNSVFVASREGRLTRAFVRNETLNGQRCAVYRVEERPAPGKPEKAMAGEIWIDRDTSVAVQGVYQTVTLPPNVKSYRMTVAYNVVGDRWALSRASINITGGTMFVKRQLQVEKTFSGWMPPAR